MYVHACYFFLFMFRDFSEKRILARGLDHPLVCVLDKLFFVGFYFSLSIDRTDLANQRCILPDWCR